MNVEEALKILEMDYESITPEQVRKKYREAMKINHPDVGGNTQDAVKINLAYKVLEKAAINVRTLTLQAKAKSEAYLITVEELIKIYNKEGIKKTGTTRDTSVELNRDNIGSKTIILVIDTEVTVGGHKVEETTTEIKNYRDKYNVNIAIDKDGVCIGEEIRVIVCGKEVNTKVAGDKMLIPIVLPYNVQVYVRINFEEKRE